MPPHLRHLAALLLATATAASAAPDGAVRHAVPCTDGLAEGFACSNVDLAAHVDLPGLGASAGQDGNDVWGWTDPLDGREYALIGVGNGTAFVDVTEPDHPHVLGLLPTHSSNSLWRDVKVIGNHALVVSEATGHGMQVFDLTRLRDVATPPVTFTEDAHYDGFGRAHNIVVNQDTQFAFAVGSRQGTTTCSGGLHMIDVSNPLLPQFAGCYSADGYTHDAQCVVYSGPDADYTGHELCFNSNEDTLTIVDVTNKGAPALVARVGYPGSAYTHQGWLVPGQRWYLMDDELDELNHGHATRTYIWDLSDLDDPQQAFTYTGPVGSSDHNLYVRDQYAFLANYKSGLRILDLSGIAQGTVVEAGFFDTFPTNDDTGFDGAWSSYPFFDSGTVLVSDISRGLFVLQPRLCEEPAAASGLQAIGTGNNSIDIAWDASGVAGATYELHRELGGCGAGPGEPLVDGLLAPAYSDGSVSGLVDYGYRVRVVDPGGQCRSAFSECVQASTVGACTAPPQFDGLKSASTPATERCAVDLAWHPATASCSGPVTYEVHRSTEADFLPGPDTLVQQGLAGTATSDYSVETGQAYQYLVRSRDTGNDASDANLVRMAATPVGPPTTGTWSNGAEDGEPFLGTGGVMPLHIAWHSTDLVAHSGARSYVSGYANADCIALATPAIDLGAGGSAVLEFHHRYGIESGWDGGRVELSTDGELWVPLTPQTPYPGEISDAGNVCGWAPGTPVYTGTDLSWHPQTIDLSAWSGQVYLRWVFSTDAFVSAEGWWIDTISVSPAQVSGSCSTVPMQATLSITSHQPQPSVAGEPVTVSFALMQSPPDPAATGTVTVSADGANPAETCTAVLPQDSCQLPLLAPGLREITASWPGAKGLPALSDSVLHEVVPMALFADGFEATPAPE